MPSNEDFDDYVAARWPRLVRTAVLLGCSREDAEDAVQSTLVRCFPVWARIQRTENPDGYVYRALRNVIVRNCQRRCREEDRLASARLQSAVTENPASDDRAVVLEALQTLPLGYREVLVLRFFADLSEKETGRVLGVAIGTVKSRTSRALRTLRDNEGMQGLMGRGRCGQ